MTQMLLWMTVALSLMTVSLACRCMAPRDEDYCNRDIVFRGRAVADYLGQTVRIYTVNVDKIFWSNSSLVGMTTFNLTTTTSSAACGAYFQLNTPYVIAATESNGQLETSSCSGNADWNSLDKKRKKFFKKRLRGLCA